MKKILIPIILAILVAACVFFGTSKYYQSIQEKEIDRHGIVETEKTLYGEIIKDGFREMGTLVTEEYYFTEVEKYSNSKKLKGIKLPLTTKSFTYSYDGSIKAGIDFGEIVVEEDEEQGIITITVPKAFIVDATIDYDSFKEYTEKNSVFNPLSITDKNESDNELLDKAKANAQEKGVLEKHRKMLKPLSKTLLTGLWTRKYTR